MRPAPASRWRPNVRTLPTPATREPDSLPGAAPWRISTPALTATVGCRGRSGAPVAVPGRASRRRSGSVACAWRVRLDCRTTRASATTPGARYRPVRHVRGNATGPPGDARDAAMLGTAPTGRGVRAAGASKPTPRPGTGRRIRRTGTGCMRTFADGAASGSPPGCAPSAPASGTAPTGSSARAAGGERPTSSGRTEVAGRSATSERDET